MIYFWGDSFVFTPQLVINKKGGALEMLQRYIALRDQERRDSAGSSGQPPVPKHPRATSPGPGEHALTMQTFHYVVCNRHSFVRLSVSPAHAGVPSPRTAADTSSMPAAMEVDRPGIAMEMCLMAVYSPHLMNHN